MIEFRTCNWEVADSNLSWGYFAPRSTQHSIPPGSVNEYQLRLGRQRQVQLIPLADINYLYLLSKQDLMQVDSAVQCDSME